MGDMATHLAASLLKVGRGHHHRLWQRAWLRNRLLQAKAQRQNHPKIITHQSKDIDDITLNGMAEPCTGNAKTAYCSSDPVACSKQAKLVDRCTQMPHETYRCCSAKLAYTPSSCKCFAVLTNVSGSGTALPVARTLTSSTTTGRSSTKPNSRSYAAAKAAA